MSKMVGGTFAMAFPKDVAFEAKTIPATDFPVYERQLKPIGFEKASVFDVIDGDGSCGGMRWNLPADPSVWLSWLKKDGVITLKTGRGGDKVYADARHFDSIAKESVAYWKIFWSEGARVKVPDPVVQRIFDYGMYRFGAMTDPDGVPAGLQGVWLERRLPLQHQRPGVLFSRLPRRALREPSAAFQDGPLVAAASQGQRKEIRRH